MISSYHHEVTERNWEGDFPGSPVVKTLPSNAGGVDLIPSLGAKIPHALCPKKKKKKHEKKEEEEAIVKYSIKTFKMVLIRVEKISTQSPSWTGESPFQHSTGRPALAKPPVAMWTGLGRASELSRIWKLDFPVWCFCFKVVQAHESLSLES